MDEFSAFLELLVMLMSDPRMVLLFGLLAVAAVIDCRTSRIPNWLTLGGTALALAYAAVVPFPAQHGFLWSLAGLGLGLGAMLPLYAFRIMGAGDVKLMAMAGAFLGFADTGYAIVGTLAAGGVFAIGFALYHRALLRMLANVRLASQAMVISAMAGMRPRAADGMKSVGKMPYGVAICVGTIGYVLARQFGYL